MSRVQTLEREAERAADQLFDKEAELEDLSSKAEALIDMLEQTDIELDDTIQEAMEAVRLCL